MEDNVEIQKLEMMGVQKENNTTLTTTLPGHTRKFTIIFFLGIPIQEYLILILNELIMRAMFLNSNQKERYLWE